jgi:hypothetical protein
MVPGNLFRRMLELDGTERTLHPVVQGQAAIDTWLESLLKVARQKVESGL